VKSSLEKRIVSLLTLALEKAGVQAETDKISLDRPADHNHGDYSSNVALIYAKKVGIAPRELAESIIGELKKSSDLKEVKDISVAGAGFINFTLDGAYVASEALAFSDTIKVLKTKSKVMVEYTDPNPFKIFHIGHLMANTIGESIARITESAGAKVIRACYQGDVGLHVAKTIWAIQKDMGAWPSDGTDTKQKVKFLGEKYVEASKYDEDEKVQKEIATVNKKIFERTDDEINRIYDAGRKWSLEYFEGIYAKLGTKFDRYFFESEVANDGVAIVKEFLKKGVFEESEGAVIFPGEKNGVHTRVFVTSQGLPTYEAKELGLNKKKFELEPDLDGSIIVTANEQNDYFTVLLKAISLIYPDIAAKTKHISHGMMRFASGKMSSRKGNIIAAEDLIGEVESLVKEKIGEREYDSNLKESIVRDVSVAAIKYSILRQAVGGDIIYDPKTSVSFEGDSGPYLQYATVRARSVMEKAKEEGIGSVSKGYSPEKITLLERLLIRFPEVVEKSRTLIAPHHITTYLTELAGEYNRYYSQFKIVDKDSNDSPYRVGITKAFVNVMENGLSLLGIRVPEKM
jgi:arginyl-tRNA synthetase